MTYRELLLQAELKLDHNDITLGEFEQMIAPLNREVDVLDKIRAEIEGKYRVILKGTLKDDWAVRWNDCIDEVLQIIDKYKAERNEE